ncbi:hypothetical protein J8273_3780 [Carpediemonas membranifera]|uniref:Uncharacterized protein n=1 Tax=Carpediemonas membranifera TaxID=201153 RepID=A0A8J6B3A5_9EUKA|nr:hypothetical protein J8273_3780 [Carpediemonas membranifera]|eukprot:KAG9394803.1 hypothetical protein J8273_3780 [Carpediemonas membranifera]
MNANEQEELTKATAKIAELSGALDKLKEQLDDKTEEKKLKTTVAQLQEEANLSWKRPASQSMKEEAEFLEDLYRGFKFGRLNGYGLLSRLYLRHRVLWCKDRYGYLVGLSVATAGSAALAEKPDMGPEKIDSEVVFKTLAKNPHLKERTRQDEDFRKPKKPKRANNR